MRVKCGWMTGYAKILFLTIPDDYRYDKQPTLADNVSSFKVTSEICEHKEVIKRVLDWLIGIMYCVMEDLASKLKPMWYLKFLSIEEEFIFDDWNFFCLNRVSSYTSFTLEHLNDDDDSLRYL